MEEEFSTNTKQQLEKMGYNMKLAGEIGRTEVIKIVSATKKEAAADIRGDDSASGY
jgi:gamma-glutamyltranspeptidase